MKGWMKYLAINFSTETRYGRVRLTFLTISSSQLDFKAFNLQRTVTIVKYSNIHKNKLLPIVKVFPSRMVLWTTYPCHL